MKKISDISKECIARWGKEDKNTINFSNKVGKFISQLGAERETGEILLKLLESYNYYSREKVNEILKSIYLKIEELELPKQRTIYSRIEKGHKINSSSNLLEEFKIINNISNNYSHDITKMGVNELTEIDCIVFLDDIIGSGNTVVKFLKANKEKIQDKTIFLFCIEIMKCGKKNIEDYLKTINCEHIIFSHVETEKAFSNNGIFKDASLTNRKKLYDFEKNKIKVGKNYVLGYDESEALVTFYRNTPNNTIGSYWYKNENWTPLFPRELDKPDFMNKTHKKDNVKYNLAKIIKEKGIDMVCTMI